MFDVLGILPFVEIAKLSNRPVELNGRMSLALAATDPGEMSNDDSIARFDQTKRDVITRPPDGKHFNGLSIKDVLRRRFNLKLTK